MSMERFEVRPEKISCDNGNYLGADGLSVFSKRCSQNAKVDLPALVRYCEVEVADGRCYVTLERILPRAKSAQSQIIGEAQIRIRKSRTCCPNSPRKASSKQHHVTLTDSKLPHRLYE